jgi:hypothetical protein
MRSLWLTRFGSLFPFRRSDLEQHLDRSQLNHSFS